MEKCIYERIFVIFAVIIQVIAEEKFKISFLSSSKSTKINESYVSAGEFLSSAMHTDVHYCSNFYDFACGNSGKDDPLPFGKLKTDLFISTEEKIKKNLEDILQSSRTPDDMDILLKANQSFQACMNLDNIERYGLDGINDILCSVGGWTLTKTLNDSEKEEAIPWQAFHKEYMADFGVFGLFNVKVDLGLFETDRYNIWLSKPEFPFVNTENNIKDKYVQFILAVVQALSNVTDTKDTIKYRKQKIEDIVDFEINLVEIATRWSSVTTKLTIQQFQREWNWMFPAGPRANTYKIDWINAIRGVFAGILDNDIEVNDDIYVQDTTYFVALAKLLNNMAEETVVNYVQWKLVLRLLPYTTKEMRRYFDNALYDATGNYFGNSRNEWCLEEIGMTHALDYVWGLKHVTDTVMWWTERVFLEIKSAMSRQVKETCSFSKDQKRIVQTKLQKMKLYSGYPGWYTNWTMIDYYKDLEVTDNFFHNMLNRWRFELYKERRLLQAKNDTKRWDIRATQVGCDYNFLTNTVTVPAGIMQEHFYVSTRPDVMNYGMLGVLIGREVARILQPLLYWCNNHECQSKYWLSESITAWYNDNAQCFINKYNRYMVNDQCGSPIYRVNGRQTLDNNIADYVGSELAYAAYDRRDNDIGPDKTSLYLGPGYKNFKGDMIFYLSQAKMHCSSHTNEYLSEYAPEELYSINMYRVIGPMSNSKQFMSIFECPPGTLMNPNEKCSIWI